MDLEERWKKDGKRKDERGQDKEGRLGYRSLKMLVAEVVVQWSRCMAVSTMTLNPRLRPQESTLFRHKLSFHLRKATSLVQNCDAFLSVFSL